MNSIERKLLDLANRKEKGKLGGGQKRIDKQHEKGKYSARERLEKILDDGSFEEFDLFVTHRCTDFGMEKNRPYGDGVVTGQLQDAAPDGSLTPDVGSVFRQEKP